MQRNKPTRFYSTRQETHVADASNGKRVANSGATAFHKGDVITDLFLIECKTKTAPSERFTLNREWILKNEEEAFAMNRPYSAVAVDFGDGSNYYVINERAFKQFIELLEKEREDGNN